MSFKYLPVNRARGHKKAMDLLIYIDTVLIIALLLLVSVGIILLYRLHKTSCQIYEKQIEIETRQMQLKYDLHNKKSNSIFS
jgi:hypothetical protein